LKEPAATPMIDVYAARGTFAAKKELTKDLTAAMMRWEGVPPISLFKDNTAAFIHDAALTSLDGLDLENYYLLHAVRADMLRRLGRDDEAATAYDAAIARTNNLTEREHIQRRLDGLAPAE
jgi:predicted RNA polymerase sigma factor